MITYPVLSDEERTLRRMLWLRHDPSHFHLLYGDDGEMQCAECRIDFLRMPPQEIEERFYVIGMERLAREQNQAREQNLL